ncbi:hypothetical protein TNCV_1099891 [Trichonephila clavipes]|nr:hypothetical protein TNCV_1099891 [Trichonephila clavipes]
MSIRECSPFCSYLPHSMHASTLSSTEVMSWISNIFSQNAISRDVSVHLHRNGENTFPDLVKDVKELNPPLQSADLRCFPHSKTCNMRCAKFSTFQKAEVVIHIA